MAKFVKYSSLENAKEALVNKLLFDHKEDLEGEWVVTEKVHGANFSFICDGTNVSCAKRNSALTGSESFFSWTHILKKYREKVLVLFDIVKTEMVRRLESPEYAHLFTPKKREFLGDIKFITIYGELFGGYYPHPDKEHSPAENLIQHGIYYTPENEFYAFDVLVNGSFWIDYDFLIDALTKASFEIYAYELFRGTFDSAMEYSRRTNADLTTVPGRFFGLPDIPDNIREGNIVKPVHNKNIRDIGRLVLKDKNSKWIEKLIVAKPLKEKKPKVDGEDTGDGAGLVKVKIYEDPVVAASILPEDLEGLGVELFSYITANRVRNLLSKTGVPHNPPTWGKFKGEYCQDVIEDFLKDNREEYQALEKEKQKVLTKRMTTLVNMMLEDNKYKIYKNEF